ncbi:Trm112 family protein [Asticcacaulis sp. YBE204]|uniref:Trm112 family protein n=1 Tax=Asticcacaulis sp. YBE204 TaxID=1282363 RepID=UPI0003C4000A|nr:Trm112 family protein [Asticcacaulis sp. YBE204]ESQ80980.1 hypothetical protein AEYBE204_01260 [Asticcacaulis sp. YBE204]
MSDIEIEAPTTDSPVPDTSEIDPRLLEALVCPVTRRPLTYDKTAQELISPSAGLAFPIRSGVPIMLVDQARRFEPLKS